MRAPLTLCALLAALASPASAFEIVSQAEARQDSQAPESFVAKALPTPGAPAIELLSPDVKRPLTGAVNIAVRWAATDGAAIDLNSFKVLYGRLRIDVTQRIAGHAKLTPTGLEAPNASLPEGSHRLMIQIADSQQRVGRHEVTLEVTGKP